MKVISLLSAIVLALSATSAMADHRHHQKWARVVDVEPVYRWVKVRVPERRCWTDTVVSSRPSSGRVAGTLAGGLIGAAVGQAAGHDHHSRHAGAAIGSVVGMAVGSEVARNKGHGDYVEYRDVKRCKMVNQYRRERELLGYDVVYRLRGHLYQTHTRHHPGQRIMVAHHAEKHYRYHGKKYRGDHDRKRRHHRDRH